MREIMNATYTYKRNISPSMKKNIVKCLEMNNKKCYVKLA